jgi:hypothetical protein
MEGSASAATASPARRSSGKPAARTCSPHSQATSVPSRGHVGAAPDAPTTRPGVAPMATATVAAAMAPPRAWSATAAAARAAVAAATGKCFSVAVG